MSYIKQKLKTYIMTKGDLMGLTKLLKKQNDEIRHIRKSSNSILNDVKGIAQNRNLMRRNDHNNKMRDRFLYRQIMSGIEVDRLTEPGMARNLRGWALSPDALLEIFDYISAQEPKLILELGGGYSTQVMSSYIRNNNLQTKIISVDHEKDFLEKTKHICRDYDNVTFVHAPLRVYGKYRWYDGEKINDALKKQNTIVDMILVDGPPQETNDNARQPLLNHIDMSRIAKKYTIILDDAARDGEKNAVEKWLKTDEKLIHKYIDTEKGLSILSTIYSVVEKL